MIDLLPEDRQTRINCLLLGALLAVIAHLLMVKRQVHYLGRRDTEQLCRDAAAAQQECDDADRELAAADRAALKSEVRSEVLRELRPSAPISTHRNAEDA